MLHKIDFWPILPSTFEGRLNVGFADFHPGAGLADDVSAHKSKKPAPPSTGRNGSRPEHRGLSSLRAFSYLQ